MDWTSGRGEMVRGARSAALSVTDTPVGVPLFLSVNKLARSPLFPVLPGLPSPKQS